MELGFAIRKNIVLTVCSRAFVQGLVAVMSLSSTSSRCNIEDNKVCSAIEAETKLAQARVYRRPRLTGNMVRYCGRR